MRFRNLRIAFSAACGTVCLLLIVLWVRSIWLYERVEIPIPSNSLLTLSSAAGTAEARLCIYPVLPVENPSWFSGKKDFAKDFGLSLTRRVFGGFGFVADDGEVYDIGLNCPYWFLITCATVLAGAPWIRCRFSVRTLLIAATLVAVMLGLILYSAR
jgi:hypothetical protein